MATLQNGSRGDDVKKLQTALTDAGYSVGSAGADGIYGKNTTSAVSEYQKANGLTVSGVADEATLNKLYGVSTNTDKNAVNGASANNFNVNGVPENVLDTVNEKFDASDDTDRKFTNAENAVTNFMDLAGKTDVIDQNTWNKINSGFEVPNTVANADSYLQQMLSKIQSGRTSYTDEVEAMMNQILNRDKFSYDVDSDPLFQQALASAMNSGQTAMQDTIGQASALTGGYGSTYATTAGNQAYNAYIQDAYNNLPEYYNLALQAYQMEGQEMYQQLGLLSDADAREYSRTVDAFNATYQRRTQMYNDAFNEWSAETQNAYNSANLQLNEYGQQVSNAYNSAALLTDMAENQYAREFNSWNAEVQQALQAAGIYNSDWWAQKNFDEQHYWNEKNFNESVRQFNASLARSGGSGRSGSSSYGKKPTTEQFEEYERIYKLYGEDAALKYVYTLPEDIDVNWFAAYEDEYPLEEENFLGKIGVFFSGGNK